jgi:hypothetical protein
VTELGCDYCDEGNLAVGGWHEYPDAFTGYTARVPCQADPPSPLEELDEGEVLSG